MDFGKKKKTFNGNLWKKLFADGILSIILGSTLFLYVDQGGSVTKKFDMILTNLGK